MSQVLSPTPSWERQSEASLPACMPAELSQTISSDQPAAVGLHLKTPVSCCTHAALLLSSFSCTNKATSQDSKQERWQAHYGCKWTSTISARQVDSLPLSWLSLSLRIRLLSLVWKCRA